MASDIFPFLMLFVTSFVCGVVVFRRLWPATILYVLSGSLPLIAYFSNANRWGVPFQVEQVLFHSGMPILLLGLFLVWKKRALTGGPGKVTMLLSSVALCSAGYIGLMIWALSVGE